VLANIKIVARSTDDKGGIGRKQHGAQGDRRDQTKFKCAKHDESKERNSEDPAPIIATRIPRRYNFTIGAKLVIAIDKCELKRPLIGCVVQFCPRLFWCGRFTTELQLTAARAG
jgi:hypothetical protein